MYRNNVICVVMVNEVIYSTKPPQDLPHIFEPLYRAEKSRNPETGGIGLGLTIAKRIFKAHGGDLSAANRIQGGAEFFGWLPLSDQLPLHRDAKS
jgi:signal transduction histidine kinase